MQNKTLAVYEPRPHTITGWPDQVESALRTAHGAGRLVTDPRLIRDRLLPLSDGRVSVRVTLLERSEPPKRPSLMAHEISRALLAALAFVAAVTGLLVGAFFVLASAFHTAMQSPAVRQVGGLLLALGCLWLVWSVTRGHACKGIHCDGCSHH